MMGDREFRLVKDYFGVDGRAGELFVITLVDCITFRADMLFLR